jgi:hypothetical protein
MSSGISCCVTGVVGSSSLSDCGVIIFMNKQSSWTHITLLWCRHLHGQAVFLDTHYVIVVSSSSWTSSLLGHTTLLWCHHLHGQAVSLDTHYFIVVLSSSWTSYLLGHTLLYCGVVIFMDKQSPWTHITLLWCRHLHGQAISLDTHYFIVVSSS